MRRFNTGAGASNVIPESVELQGTLRALRTDTFERLHARIRELANATAAAYGCSISEVEYSAVPYPPTQVGAQAGGGGGGVTCGAWLYGARALAQRPRGLSSNAWQAEWQLSLSVVWGSG